MYLLDSNIFIEASRRYYAFDLVPNFWVKLLECSKSGKIKLISQVYVEVVDGGNDELKDWLKSSFPNPIKVEEDESTISFYREMISSVMADQKYRQFKDSAKAEFASVADSWIIAYAKANELTVVTHEVFKKDAKKRIPIPNICNEYGIRVINTFDFLRELKIQV